MCRYEAFLYVQKMQDLEEGGADVQIPHELAKAGTLRIGATRAMDSHPGGIILYDYSEVKEKGRSERVESQKLNVASCGEPSYAKELLRRVNDGSATA